MISFTERSVSTQHLSLAKKSVKPAKSKASSSGGSKIDKSRISAPDPASFTHVAHMGYDSDRGFVSTGVDASWKALLDDVRDQGISEEVIRENEGYIRQFVKERQAASNINAIDKRKKPPPPPAPRRSVAPPLPSARAAAAIPVSSPPAPPPTLVKPAAAPQAPPPPARNGPPPPPRSGGPPPPLPPTGAPPQPSVVSPLHICLCTFQLP